jgi:hypothetical protein
VPGGAVGPHDDVLDQVADGDENARAAGIMSVTHFAVPISRATRTRLSGLTDEVAPGPGPDLRREDLTAEAIGLPGRSRCARGYNVEIPHSVDLSHVLHVLNLRVVQTFQLGAHVSGIRQVARQDE